jgi:hypothetical protein
MAADGIGGLYAIFETNFLKWQNRREGYPGTD